MRSLFFEMCANQRPEYSAYVSSVDFEIASASPELFFDLNGTELRAKPMKGTSRRGLTFTEDAGRIEQLKRSVKERAENLMIVDMVRNDLGRVARPGSVVVPKLFDVERYPTVLQMTSTITCESDASFPEIVAAMFPCASVTGAPKVRTMEIIHDLEGGPRGVYTGSIGYLLPDRRARFNVAIRTASRINREMVVNYGIGSGVLWDSDPKDEYRECLLKAAVITDDRPEFDLLETMLWEKDLGFFLLERHLERLRHSAIFFGYPVDIAAVSSALEDLSRGFEGAAVRLRLLVSSDGFTRFETSDHQSVVDPPVKRVGVASQCVDSNDVFLYHKTTNRTVYEQALKSRPYDDVLLFNERDEVTESTVANVVVEMNGKLFTPPIECGLLAGTYRQYLIDKSEIEERKIRIKDLKKYDRIFLVNSIQKEIPCVIDVPRSSLMSD
jgi:para-aminobenzoate synthetase/4-amino-4-deoxychorismate lyase